MTFVYVTHDQEEALSMSDWVAVINEGRVEQAGTPAEIYHQPQTVFVAGFVGAANLVPTSVLGMPGDGLLCVRPEVLRIGRPQRGELCLRGEVQRSAILGAHRRYWVDVDGREWIVDEPAPREEALTGPVEVALDPRRAHAIEDAE